MKFPNLWLSNASGRNGCIQVPGPWNGFGKGGDGGTCLMRAFHHLDKHVHRISNFALLIFLLLLSLLTIILNLFLFLFPISG